MSDYDTPYDLAADQYANGDYDTYVGEATGPDGVVYDVEVHPTKHDTLVVTGPNGRGREVDADESKHRQGESLEAAYLRIATEHLKENRMTGFTDLYPTPDHETVTATQMAGYRAAEALWLLGRADRRRELHGPADSEAVHMTARAGILSEVAYALHAADNGAEAGHIAHMLLLNQLTGEATEHRAETIARRNGYDPRKARAAGYES